MFSHTVNWFCVQLYYKLVVCTAVHTTDRKARLLFIELPLLQLIKMEKLTIKRKEKGEHTCPEVLIKLSELIKRSLQFGKIINSYSLIRYGQIVIGI